MELNWATIDSIVACLDDNRIFVLTGGANAGKTTVINELRRLGLPVIDEQASKIISSKGSSVRDDLPGFVREIWNQQFLDELPLRRSGQPAVSDRGIYDQATYYAMDKLAMPADLRRAISLLESKGPFYRLAFVLDTLETWVENGIRDAENLDYSVRFGHTAEKVYQAHGIKTVRIPALSLTERMEMILGICRSE